jgi:hypothetical protein
MGWNVGEVEPCPFCGHIGEFSPRPYQHPNGLFQMECGVCHALGPTDYTASGAKTMWDGQHKKMGEKLQAERQEVARLRKVIDEYAKGLRKPTSRCSAGS